MATNPDVLSGSPSNLGGYLDGILRHREDYFSRIFDNKNVLRHAGMLLLIVFVLTGLHGLAIGYSSGYLQMLSTAVKLPLLYLLTTVVCFPVLYVVNVIIGSRLGFIQTYTLILMSLALNAILLASCAPIVLFFILTGASYTFLKLLEVGILGFSGLWAMVGLWRGLVEMCETSSLYPKRAIRILQIWIVVFGLVGLQMTWVMRPFVGSPNMPFELFRETGKGNIYEDIASSVSNFLD